MHSSVPIPEALARALASVRRVAILTGAGVSAESGVATFRDAQTGLWARFDARDLATPSAFAKNPKLVWDWYAWRREKVAVAEPNAGHLALAEIERRVPEFLLITQNVDGLHQRAGTRNLVELHGNIGRVRCSREDRIVDHWQDTEGAVPRCARCGALLRPDVVWFEEMLPPTRLPRPRTPRNAATSCSWSARRRKSTRQPHCLGSQRQPGPSSLKSTRMRRHYRIAPIMFCAVLRATLPVLVAAAWPDSRAR